MTRKISRKAIAVMGSIFLLLMVAGLLSSVFFLSYFTVQDVVISRKDFRVQAAEVARFVRDVRGKNIFLVSEKDIQNTLYNKFPEIKTIEMKREVPNKITISVSTYPIAFRWSCEQVIKKINESGDITEEVSSKLFYVNQKGMISIPNPDEKEVFLIYEKTPCRKVGNRDQILSEKIVEQIFEAKNLLEKILETSVIRVEYLPNAQEVHMVTGNETTFWIDFITPVSEQIQKLQIAIPKTPELTSDLDHVDLRVPGKIFYE